MSQGEEERLEKMLQVFKGVAFLILMMHFYWYCFGFFDKFGFSHKIVSNFLMNINQATGFFKYPIFSQLGSLFILGLGLMGTKGKKDQNIKWRDIYIRLGIGFVLFFAVGSVLRTTTMPVDLFVPLYIFILSLGFVFLLNGGTLISRLLGVDLKDDVFNVENESFEQEERWLVNPNPSIPTIHLPTKYYYNGKWNDGMINVVNPHRATNVLGTPGSGKSFAIINEYIRQFIEQGNAMYVYDYKFPILTNITYNHFRLHHEAYAKNGGKMPKVYIINFDNPSKSHRCNPLHPSFLSDITDAYESAYVIMMNLNRTWIKKQGDFFVESPITLLAAIIWFLKIYKDPLTGVSGKFCTFPHAIELLNQKYNDLFTVLAAYPDLENYMSPFIDALEGGAQEQLQGQIASAKIPLSRIISPELYWVLSGNDFTLDINNPEEPKILCLGNNPKREGVYGAALGLYNFRIVQICNAQGKLPCALIVDELPTMYFGKIDRLIGTARSNKIAVCLGFQDYSQLTKDYGKEEMNVIVNTVGNVFAGQVLGDSAKGLSERFGKNLQQKKSISINKNDTSTSINTQMDALIPAGKISNLRQGTFVGSVAEDFGVEMTQNIFHANILVDISKIKADEKNYVELPVITRLEDAQGNSILSKAVEQNYYQIKADVVQIIKDELWRIENDPQLCHLIKDK